MYVNIINAIYSTNTLVHRHVDINDENKRNINNEI